MRSEANPLLSDAYRIPFHRIRAEHVEPGIRQALAEAQREIDALAADTAPPTWENTVGRLDRAVERLGRRITPASPPRLRGRDAGAAGGLQRGPPRDVRLLVPAAPERGLCGSG